jgi:hypothetical protein
MTPLSVLGLTPCGNTLVPLYLNTSCHINLTGGHVIAEIKTSYLTPSWWLAGVREYLLNGNGVSMTLLGQTDCFSPWHTLWRNRDILSCGSIRSSVLSWIVLSSETDTSIWKGTVCEYHWGPLQWWLSYSAFECLFEGPGSLLRAQLLLAFLSLCEWSRPVTLF